MVDRCAPLARDLYQLAHELNQRFATELSSVTFERFAELIEAAVYARAVGRLDGFLLAFDETCSVDGENFNWFKRRHERFLYVDRIAVAPPARGRGVARRLYADLEDWARSRACPLICCEVNVRPPNPASDRLHEALGFTEIAQCDISTGKLVRYLVKRLAV